MREVTTSDRWPESEADTFRACLATILELAVDAVPEPEGDEDVAGRSVMRWLGGLGLGLVPVLDPGAFAWAGPWIARVIPAGEWPRRAVVMYGVPSGVAWDPSGVTAGEGWRIEDGFAVGATTGERWRIEDGFVVAALDIALARPALAAAPIAAGTVETIFLASTAGVPPQPVTEARALAGRGLEGDRHTTGKGTFPSGVPGSALTLIEAEVCESFVPPLAAGEHRRNVITRGIDLNALVGHEFAIGTVRCRGMRLCEPCTVLQGYAARAVLRPLVHRGGLRADVLTDGLIRVGDRVQAGELLERR
ncbi:MAG: hypothetical protein M3071_13395 [Actinomycetota bacterium]|nr:hypothetical protein [Actinomycetota bacterium]